MFEEDIQEKVQAGYGFVPRKIETYEELCELIGKFLLDAIETGSSTYILLGGWRYETLSRAYALGEGWKDYLDGCYRYLLSIAEQSRMRSWDVYSPAKVEEGWTYERWHRYDIRELLAKEKEALLTNELNERTSDTAGT